MTKAIKAKATHAKYKGPNTRGDQQALITVREERQLRAELEETKAKLKLSDQKVQILQSRKNSMNTAKKVVKHSREGDADFIALIYNGQKSVLNLKYAWGPTGRSYSWEPFVPEFVCQNGHIKKISLDFAKTNDLLSEQELKKYQNYTPKK